VFQGPSVNTFRLLNRDDRALVTDGYGRVAAIGVTPHSGYDGAHKKNTPFSPPVVYSPRRTDGRKINIGRTQSDSVVSFCRRTSPIVLQRRHVPMTKIHNNKLGLKRIK